VLETSDAVRSAYVIRVNIHNNGWDGSICSKPTLHADCKARAEFKAGCAAGNRSCFFLGLFQPGRPAVRLINRQEPYQQVFKKQRSEPGDLAIFWGTYADGRNAPVGLWEVGSFDDERDRLHFIVEGRPSTVVRFSPRVANQAVLEQRVSRATGADMIRLLPADQVHVVLQRWIEDHEKEMERLTALGKNTDDVRDALEGLRNLYGIRPEASTDHLTYRPFASIDLPVHETHPDLASAEMQATDATPGIIEPAGSMSQLATFPKALVDDYAIALEVSQLVVLAGPSGAGKTRLTHAYAMSVGAEYLLVPVRPDWRSNEDLLGYLPPFGEAFVPSEFTKFVLDAAQEWDQADGRAAKRFHVCLDEMNLARPEYYLAEVLSRMELEPEQRWIHLYDAAEDHGFPRAVLLPPNLSIVGTVNNDDTTHALSPKVLDRAVYLNLDVIDLEAWFESRPEELARWVGPHLVELDARIAPTGMRIGYRAALQVLRWVGHAIMQGTGEYAGLDTALSMLVFPRLRVQRAEPRHRDMLDQLEAYLDQEAPESGALFPRSLSVVRSLKERLERREFAFGQFET